MRNLPFGPPTTFAFVATIALGAYASTAQAQDPTPSGSITYEAAFRMVIVTGTPDDDTLHIAPENDNVRVSLSTGGVVQSFPFPAAIVDRIVFEADMGNDQVVNLSSVALVAKGGLGDDRLWGGTNNDILSGGPGNDELIGGAGVDILFGDDGDDTIVGEEGNDQAYGGEGVDTVSGGPGNDFIDGGGGDDTLSGGDGNDSVNGGPGADFIRGGDGSDSLGGGTEDDTLEGEAGVDFLVGGDGNDTLKGGTENDVLSGGLGDDVMTGDEHNDVLRGGPGNDILSGHDGEDQLWGEGGDDGVDGGFGPDQLHGGAGNDVLVGGPHDDLLFGDDGDDYLLGAGDVDELDGGAGNDTLQGDTLDSLLEGGTGTNTISTVRSTRLGIVPNPSNEPLSTDEDIIRAFERAGVLSDNISIFWTFRAQSILAERSLFLDAIHNEGKTSFMQLGIQFFGDPVPPAGMAESYGDPAVRALFLDNVRQIAAKQPNLFNLAAELNFLYWINPPEFDHFATLYQEAYQAIKEVSPETKVGASFHYTLFRACEQFDALDALGPRDFVAFTVYPIWLIDKEVVDTVDALPVGWWKWMRDIYPDDEIVISELGMPNSINSTPEIQAEFVRKLPELFAAIQPSIVNWILLSNVGFFEPELLNEEQIQFLLDVGVNPEVLFGRLNNNGLHSHDGIPRPAWFEAVKLDLDSYDGPLAETIDLAELPALCARPASPPFFE